MFKFTAREYDAATNDPGSYYDGGTGQSGGEKEKLTLLVLIAAIAYQCDLRPDGPGADRFHFDMVDKMFSRSNDTHAKYALNLFAQFGLQVAIVAPLDTKARITESYVGTYGHIIKDPEICWGDFDADGFVILDRLRRLLPKLQSLLMDERTVSVFANLVTNGNGAQARELEHLTHDERRCYHRLCETNTRIEQEHLPIGAVTQSLRIVPVHRDVGP